MRENETHCGSSRLSLQWLGVTKALKWAPDRPTMMDKGAPSTEALLHGFRLLVPGCS